MFYDIPYTDDPFAAGAAVAAGSTIAQAGTRLGSAQSDSNGVDVITTTTTAANTRNAEELSARIKASGGVVKTNANSSDYIVAVNNRLKFSVTQEPDGSYQIRESSYFWLAIGAVALVGLVVVKK